MTIRRTTMNTVATLGAIALLFPAPAYASGDMAKPKPKPSATATAEPSPVPTSTPSSEPTLTPSDSPPLLENGGLPETRDKPSDPPFEDAPPANSKPDKPAKPGKPDAPVQSATTKSIVAELNKARAVQQRCGLRTMKPTRKLKIDKRLTAAAGKHAADMAARNYFSHKSPNGKHYVSRIRAEKYKYSSASEVIAAGPTFNAQSVVAAWMASPGHCRSIMNPKFTNVGVGYSANDGSDLKQYFVVDFARPKR